MRVKDLLADAVRLAIETGDLSVGAAQDRTGHAAALAAESETSHQQANALRRSMATACGTRGRRALWGRQPAPAAATALEAAAQHFIEAAGRDQARTTFTDAAEVYAALSATANVARLQAGFHAHGIPHRAARQEVVGAQRLGQPDRARDQHCGVCGGGLSKPGGGGLAAAIPADSRDRRLAHPEEARRELADRYCPRAGAVRPYAEVIAPRQAHDRYADVGQAKQAAA